MKFLAVLAIMLILTACNDKQPNEDHQSAADFRKKLDDIQKKHGEQLKKLVTKQNEKKAKEKQPADRSSNLKKVNQKRHHVGKINLFEFLLQKVEASLKSSNLQRKEALKKLLTVADGKQTKLFGVIKDVEEKITQNPENKTKQITRYIVRFSSLFIGNKHFPYNISFYYSPFITETKSKSKVIDLSKGDFVSASGYLKLQMKNNSYDGQSYLDVRFTILDIVKGLDKTTMGLHSANSPLGIADILYYLQVAQTIKKMKTGFNINVYEGSLKNFGIEANFVGNFTRKNLKERYRRKGKFDFVVSKDAQVSFREDEHLVELLLSMPKNQDVQVRGKISKFRSGIELESPSVLFKFNHHKYLFEKGSLKAAKGSLKSFDFHIYNNTLFYKGKPLPLSRFHLFLEMANKNASLVNLKVVGKKNANSFTSLVTKLIQSSAPHKLINLASSDMKLMESDKASAGWTQLKELYQIASKCEYYRGDLPTGLKELAGRWSRKLRKNLFNDYVYINSSDKPFFDNNMQEQRALIYPKKTSSKTIPIALINTGKNAHGYPVKNTTLILVRKKQLTAIEKAAKGLIKIVDLETIKKDLKTIAELCKLYQSTLGRQVRYPKALKVLLEQGIVKNTPQNQKLLQEYNYVYSPRRSFNDNDGNRQQIFIYPKSINTPKIPVLFMNYSSDNKLTMLSKIQLAKIKLVALEASSKK